MEHGLKRIEAWPPSANPEDHQMFNVYCQCGDQANLVARPPEEGHKCGYTCWEFWGNPDKTFTFKPSLNWAGHFHNTNPWITEVEWMLEPDA